MPDGTQLISTPAEVLAPNGVYTNNHFGYAGSNDGILILSEDWLFENNAWSKKRWNCTNYTQDNPSLQYMLNPRAIETKVGDAANVRRTTIDYLTQAGNPQASVYGLVSEVKVYDSNQTTILKRSTTEYNNDPVYLNKRIIGLPQKSELYDQNNALMSKVTYACDEGNFAEAGQTITAINHDTANFGAGFIAGRGNATSTTRWDVTDAKRRRVTRSVIDVLNQAGKRYLKKKRAIIHRDRGSQYASREYRRLLYIKPSFRQSMSRRGNCYDNAQVESFFFRFKAELIEEGIFESVAVVKSETFSYIKGY